MQQKKIALKEKLKQYSLLVAPVVASAGMANAQIVYHDIDPDIFYKDSIMGDSYTDPMMLDLDNDGVYDVEFAVWSSVQSNNGDNKVNLIAAKQMGGNGNAIMGYTNLFSASFCSTPLPLYCPSALNANKLIEPGANFWALPNATSLGTLVRYFKNEPPPNNFVGQWNNLTDRYVGLRFNGGDGKLHYGWIRLDVSKSPGSITVKDYGYEMQNNVSIHAGDMGNIGVQPVNADHPFSVFSSEGMVNIQVTDKIVDHATATVSNLAGQIVSTQPLNNGSTLIDLHPFGKGIYIITIHYGSESFFNKVSFW